MSTPHKEKIIRVLQLFQTTDEKTPMNAVQISQKLEEEYGMENVHRTSIYDDVRLLQSCGYPIKQAENSHKGWYMEKHLLEDWEIKLMLDSVQQARCVSVHEANEIRNKLLNLTSQRGRSRFSHMIMPLPGNVRGVGQIGEYIEIMLGAMYLHKKIRFQYTEMSNDEETNNLIVFCKTPRTRKEICDYLGLNSVTYAIQTYVNPLVEAGVIKLSIPDKPKSPKQLYYSVEREE